MADLAALESRTCQRLSSLKLRLTFLIEGRDTLVAIEARGVKCAHCKFEPHGRIARLIESVIDQLLHPAQPYRTLGRDLLYQSLDGRFHRRIFDKLIDEPCR